MQRSFLQKPSVQKNQRHVLNIVSASGRGQQLGTKGGTRGEAPARQGRRQKRHRLEPWVGKIPWRMPRTEEPGGLQSMGSQRVAHDKSDVARNRKLQRQICGMAVHRDSECSDIVPGNWKAMCLPRGCELTQERSEKALSSHSCKQFDPFEAYLQVDPVRVRIVLGLGRILHCY